MLVVFSCADPSSIDSWDDNIVSFFENSLELITYVKVINNEAKQERTNQIYWI